MAGYVFLSNSSKPSEEKRRSREDVKISNVSRPCIKAALDLGYEVTLGTNRHKPEELSCEFPIKLYDSHTYRSITAFKDNKIAYDNLCRVLDSGNVEVIHCNTPVGGLVGRLAGKKKKIKKIIYTAHGFHFYKGAPLINRTVYKWAEQIMARWTDVIITMNKEDFEAAKKFKLRGNGKVYLVHGVGVDTDLYNTDRSGRMEKRANIGLKDDDVAIISMGDLIKRKNYDTAIRAVAATQNKNLHYFICGKGPEKEALEALAKELGVSDQIHLLGFRSDIKELLSAVDLFLFTTKQEGLPRSMMEAMASGLPCVASRIRGNTDLLEGTDGGFLCNTFAVEEYAEKLSFLAENPEKREAMGKSNLETIKAFSIETVTEEIRAIYNAELPKKA
jgi:glycosyltransferase involved in cell wall biosynthesis